MVTAPGETGRGGILEPDSRIRVTDPELGNPVDSIMSMKTKHRAILALVTALTSGCSVCLELPRGASVQGYPMRRVIVYRAPAPAQFFAPRLWRQPQGVGMWVRRGTFRRIAVPSPFYAPQCESWPSSHSTHITPAVARFDSASFSQVPSDAEGRRGNTVVPLLPDP